VFSARSQAYAPFGVTRRFVQCTRDIVSMLQKFTYRKNKGIKFGNFCAVHLFTAKRFGGSVLGNAWLAKPKDVNYSGGGGICSSSMSFSICLVYDLDHLDRSRSI
jgi:hypothetical protein